MPKNHKPSVTPFTLRIPNQLKQSLEKLAEKDRRSLNEEILWIVERWLEQHDR